MQQINVKKMYFSIFYTKITIDHYWATGKLLGKRLVTNYNFPPLYSCTTDFIKYLSFFTLLINRPLQVIHFSSLVFKTPF